MKNIVDTEGKIQLVIAPRATDSSNEKNSRPKKPKPLSSKNFFSDQRDNLIFFTCLKI